MLIVLILGLLLWGGFALIFLKFHTIRIDGNNIITRNIFIRRQYSRSDFLEVAKTSFSPFIFKMKLKNSSYYFLVGYDKALKAFLSSDIDSVKNELNKAINEFD